MIPFYLTCCISQEINLIACYSPDIESNIDFSRPVVHGAMGCGQKRKISFSVAVPPAPVRVPSQRPLAPSVSSVESVANDKGDNEMILGAVHRSPGICLTAEETPENLS